MAIECALFSSILRFFFNGESSDSFSAERFFPGGDTGADLPEKTQSFGGDIFRTGASSEFIRSKKLGCAPYSANVSCKMPYGSDSVRDAAGWLSARSLGSVFGTDVLLNGCASAAFGLNLYFLVTVCRGLSLGELRGD